MSKFNEDKIKNVKFELFNIEDILNELKIKSNSNKFDHKKHFDIM